MGIIDFLTNKKTLSFLGGIAAATLGVKLLKSKSVHNATVQIVAGGMKMKDNTMNIIENIKEDAQDVYHEACQEAKKNDQEDIENN